MPTRPPLAFLFAITRMDSIGGAQIHVRDLAKQLATDGDKVTIISGSEPSDPAFLPRSVKSVISPALRRDLSLGTDVKGFRDLLLHLQQLRPDVVSLHSTKAGFLGRLACRRQNLPCLFTAHGWSFTDGVPKLRRLFYRMCERVVARCANHVVTVSDHDHKLGLELGIDPSRLTRIHNGMQDAIDETQKPRSPSEKMHVVMVARFDKQKDQPLLLKAMREVPDVTATFVGDGPLLQDRMSMAAELGVLDRSRFEGYQPDVQADLNNADAFVLCSNWEGFPRTSLEAMRASLPVVVSDVGGAKEAVVEGRTGFCIPRGDLETLIHRLRLLVRYPQLRAKMGEESRKRFLAEFTFARMYRQTVQVYDEVLGG